jgi:hypothetical protein
MHVEIFRDEFGEKGLEGVVCLRRFRRETTMIRPVLVVRFSVGSRHPLFWYQSWFRFRDVNGTCGHLSIMIVEISCHRLVRMKLV